MRIGFNGRPFCQDQMRGLARHTLELIKELKAKHPDYEFYVYAFSEISSFYKKELPFVHFRDKRIKPKIMWDLWQLRKQVLEDRIDLFHSTNNLGVPLLLFKRIPLFTTIHDHFTHDARMIIGSGIRSWMAAISYRIELFLLKKSNHFFTVSESAKTSIAQKLNIPLKKITVAYNGVNLVPTGKKHTSDQYYLYVGGLEERKNIPVMLEGFIYFAKNFGEKRVLKIVGNIQIATPESKKIINKNSELFQIINSATNAELCDLYENAIALIFPSLEEGFGLPLVEAMALGCPVIASDIDVFKEIGLGAASFFTRTNSSELAMELKKMESDKELREDRILKGLARAKDFSWEGMAKKIHQEYLKELSD